MRRSRRGDLSNTLRVCDVVAVCILVVYTHFVSPSSALLPSLPPDFDDIPESRIKELCAGGSVFFNCMGSTRKAAGSAVSVTVMLKAHWQSQFKHIKFHHNLLLNLLCV